MPAKLPWSFWESRKYDHVARFILLLVAIFLSSCTTQPIAQYDWPADLPSLNSFLESYEKDHRNSSIQSREEYLIWVKRFYQGWDLYSRGWNQITREIVNGHRQLDSKREIGDKLNQLGISIVCEWAKDNQVRLIQTRHVSAWAKAMFVAISKNESLQLIDKITADVQGLLIRDVASDSITLYRYYPEDAVLAEDPL